MSNAAATLGLLVLLFLSLNILTAAVALIVPTQVPITLTWRSALLIILSAIVLVLVALAAIKHYRVRAEGDALLYQQYLSSKKPGR